MRQITTDGGLRIGELAERAGLTDRTLHHYDQIGLMRASERTDAGHRRYSEADVRRLYQVVALRSLGVPLARIAGALEGDGFTLKDAVTAQLEAVDAKLLHARRLRRRLERILKVLERSDDPLVEELTQIMEVMRMHETYCTPEQLAQLEARREEVGSDEIAAIEREWAELSTEMKAHRDAGTDPTDPDVRARGALARPHRAHDRRPHRRRPRDHREPRPHVQEGRSGESLPRHVRRRPAGIRDPGAAELTACQWQALGFLCDPFRIPRRIPECYTSRRVRAVRDPDER